MCAKPISIVNKEPPPSPDSRLPDGRTYQEAVDELFEWANELLRSPPPPLDENDAHFMGAMAFAGICYAIHGRTGTSKVPDVFGWLRFAIRSMTGTPPRVPGADAAANEYFRLFDSWFPGVYMGGSPANAAKTEVVVAEMGRALPRLMSGFTWDGDLIKGYAAAARACNRGGWSEVRAEFERSGVIDRHFGRLDDQLLALLEGKRLERGALARTKAGLLAPAFAAAIDAARREHTQKTRTRSECLPLIAAPDLDEEHLASLVEQTRAQQALTRFQELVEAFGGRHSRSKYARAVRQHAWRLLTGTDPSSLARELGLSGRPMRREWARHLERMERDRTLGPIVKRLRAG